MNVIPLPGMASGRGKLSRSGVAPSPHFNVDFLLTRAAYRRTVFQISTLNWGRGAAEQELQARKSKIEMCMAHVWYRGVAGANEPGSAPLPM